MSDLDKTTLDLIKDVENRKKEIASLKRPNYKTNCTFCWIENDIKTFLNLHVVNDVEVLISIVAHLMSVEDYYLKAAKAIGVSKPQLKKWQGFLISDWIEDVKTRINVVSLSEKKRKLELLENRLDKIISPELKAKMELAAIQDELSES
jgi:hypothetical protein